MSKYKRENRSSNLPSDRLNSTEVSTILGIHRNTLKRMASSGTLAPDGQTGGGRNFWLRSTVDSYRLGALTSATVWYVGSPHLEGLQLPLRSGHRVLGQSAVCIPLSASNRTECLAELLIFIATTSPHALVLPAGGSGNSEHLLVADACRREGVPVILYPV